MISDPFALTAFRLAVGEGKSIRPGPAGSGEQEVVLEHEITAWRVSWELDLDVVAHPMTFLWLRRQSLIDTWGALFDVFAVPDDWRQAQVVCSLQVQVRSFLRQIVWNRDVRKLAWLCVFVRLEDPSEVTPLSGKSLSISEAHLLRLDLI